MNFTLEEKTVALFAKRGSGKTVPSERNWDTSKEFIKLLSYIILFSFLRIITVKVSKTPEFLIR